MNGSEFHGLVLIDKPSGITSHDVVAKLRKILKTKRIGHSGTLDPLASGLMVCLVNEATKISQYILEKSKSYRVNFQFGLSTDTLDITGSVLKKQNYVFQENQYREIINNFTGDFQWQVPIYSAIKVNGKKLYEYARQGEESIVIPTKNMKFWDLNLNSLTPDSAEVEVHCSKGSYIRTWVDELGKKIGCEATMTNLRRLSTEQFHINNALTIDELNEFIEKKLHDEIRNSGYKYSNFEHKALIPLSQSLSNVKRIFIKGHDLTLFKNGQISHNLRLLLIQKFDPDLDEIVQVINLKDHQLIGIVGFEVLKGFQIRRVIKYESQN